MTTTASFIIEPVDVLFFRDARPLGPGHEAASGLPMPQTLAGALRTGLLKAHGFDLAAFASRRPGAQGTDRQLLEGLGAPVDVLDARFRGPFLVQRDRGAAEWMAWLPAPRTLLRQGGRVVNGRPVGGSTSDDFVTRHARLPGGLRPIWVRDDADAERVDGAFISLEGLQRYLDGEAPDVPHLKEQAELFAVDRRTSVGIDDERYAGVDGLLFTNAYLALRNDARVETAFLVEVDASEGALARLDGLVFRFGGEGRCAIARRLPRPLGGGVASWSRAGGTGRATVVLLTPADLGAEMLPRLEGARVLAAAVGRPLGRSGFDVARGGPRPTRWLAPAGSVFFVEGQVPRGGSLGVGEDAAGIGEGLFVTGAWKV